MGLLAKFRAAAVARHQFPDDQRLEPASLFSLVRDMPLGAQDRMPSVALEEWRASPWMKHVLLHELYGEFGLTSILIYASQEITAEGWPWLPEQLRSEIEARPLPDVEAFLRLQVGSEWMAVDATWPLWMRRLGVPVNERFEAGRDMRLACDPDELFHVPDDADATTSYRAVLLDVVGAEMGRRTQFFQDLTNWIDEQTTD